MAYVPPDFNDISFTPESGYEAPSSIDIRFTPGSEGPVTQYVDVLNFPFQLSYSISSPYLVQIISVEPLESTHSLVSSILWSAPMEPLEANSAIGTPDILIMINVPVLTASSALTSTLQNRVKFDDILTSISELYITGIAEAPAGTEVVSPWPFENLSKLSVPDVVLAISSDPLNQTSTFATPFIIAGETSIVVPPPFETTSTLSGVYLLAIKLEPLEFTHDMDVLAIQETPAGDQYTVTLPFVISEELDTRFSCLFF